MSREGLIDCLGYLSMALSLVLRPLNASFSLCIAHFCQYRQQYSQEVVFHTRTRSPEDVFAHV